MIEVDMGRAKRALATRTLALLFFPLLSVACGSDEPCSGNRCAGGAGAAGVAADGFCKRWIDAFAAYVERCECGSEATAHYREQIASLCGADGGLGSLGKAVSDGSLVYHAAAADALFARLEAPNPLCAKSPFRSLGLDSRQVYSLAGTFTGTRELGQTCSLPVGYKGGVSDCASGVCAPNSTGKGGVCIALVGKGEACDASGDKGLRASSTSLCHDVRPADSDGEYETAFDSLTCITQSNGSRACATNLPDGSSCSGAESCQSGRCISAGAGAPGICAPRLAAGNECQRSADCLSGACQYGQTPTVCGPALLVDGADCHYDNAACASGSCNVSTGSERCGAPPNAENGAACTEDSQCLSGVCRNGRCVAEVCGPYLN